MVDHVDFAMLGVCEMMVWELVVCGMGGGAVSSWCTCCVSCTGILFSTGAPGSGASVGDAPAGVVR